MNGPPPPRFGSRFERAARRQYAPPLTPEQWLAELLREPREPPSPVPPLIPVPPRFCAYHPDRPALAIIHRGSRGDQNGWILLCAECGDQVRLRRR